VSTEPTIGPFRLFDSRAASAAGHEYAAMDIDTGSRVLLTVVESLAVLDGPDGVPDPEVQRAYQGVMGRLSQIDHPLVGMPRRVSPPTSDDYWYVSMATEATPVRRHLLHHGPFAWRTVALLLHEACVTLAFAHKRGLAHGNVEPGTVLVESTGAVRLVRPAVAGRVVFQRPDTSTVNLAALWDEPIYLSPDVQNRREPGPADDVYSLGVLAFELLTGRLPYSDAAEPVKRAQSRRTAPDPAEFAPEVPAAMCRFVRSMMAPRAPVRTPTAAALRAELKEQLLADLGPSDGRAALAAAIKARTAPEPTPKLSKSVARSPSSGGAEQAIEQALKAAGMTPETRGLAGRSPRRALWAAAGAALVAVVALVVTTSSGPAIPDSTEPDSELAAAPPPERPDPPAMAVAPLGVAIVQAESPPVDPKVVARLKAEALIRSGQFSLAIRVLEAALKLGEDPDGALEMLLGKALEGEGRLKEAIKAYVAADGERGSRSAGHLRAGILVAIDGRCPEALPLFLEAAARKQPTAEIFKHVGNCQLIVGDIKGALVALRKAYAADDTDLDIVVPLAQVLEKQGDRRGAMEMYRQALGIKPTDSRAREGLTRIAGVQAGSPKVLRIDALRLPEIEEVVDLDALEIAAHAAFRAGKFSTASRLYGEAVEAAGDEASASLLRNHAVALHKAGQGVRAVRAYEAAIAAAPGDAELHYLHGTVLASERQDSGARRALQAALDREPERWKARFELGLVELREGNHRAAAEAFEAVVRQRPNDKAALQNLIKARSESGDQAGALEALGRMHAAHPKDSTTLLTMAAMLQSMDRDDEATALLTEACVKGIQEACQ